MHPHVVARLWDKTKLNGLGREPEACECCNYFAPWLGESRSTHMLDKEQAPACLKTTTRCVHCLNSHQIDVSTS